jgi:lipoate-protein ligase A
MKVGTVVTSPIRVEYLNGDYGKAYDLLMEKKIKIIYKTVASVEPYHATIHVAPEDEEKAKKILEKAKIKYYPPTPFY